MITKDEVTQLFRFFRKRGWFARQNYWCCMSCGCAALEEDLKDRDRWVFYHQQDADAFNGRGVLTKKLYLAFGDDKGNPKKTKMLGQELLELIRVGGGMRAEWDGNPNTRIAILPDRVED